MMPWKHGIARVLALTAVVTISTQHKPGLSTSHHSVREEFTRLPALFRQIMAAREFRYVSEYLEAVNG